MFCFSSMMQNKQKNQDFTAQNIADALLLTCLLMSTKPSCRQLLLDANTL